MVALALHYTKYYYQSLSIHRGCVHHYLYKHKQIISGSIYVVAEVFEEPFSFPLKLSKISYFLIFVYGAIA